MVDAVQDWEFAATAIIPDMSRTDDGRSAAIRVLFINAVDVSRPVQVRYPPLGFGYLASSLTERFGAGVFEFRVANDDIPFALACFRPDIVGITAVSQNYERAKKYARCAKLSGAMVLMGGVHISALPQTLTHDMDIGVIGEGEATMCELMTVYMREKQFTPTTLSTIDGIAFHSNGRVVVTDRREPIADLDKLPPPDRSLFPVQRTTYLFTARGCPYRCTFCASSRFWGGMRSFSPAYVVREIRELVERQGVERICLYDDIFPSSSERIRTFIRLLREAKLLGRVRFSCSIRANLVTNERLELLRDMGVDEIGVGMESAAPRSLEYLKGPNVFVMDNAIAIRRIRAAGMTVHGSFIVGSPDETLSEAMRTLAFIRENDLSADLYLLTPFPGTPVWADALSRGLVSETMNWNRLDVEYSEWVDAVIMSKRMDRHDINAVFARYRWDILMRAIRANVVGGIRRPWRIPAFVYGKLRGLFHVA